MSFTARSVLRSWRIPTIKSFRKPPWTLLRASNSALKQQKCFSSFNSNVAETKANLPVNETLDNAPSEACWKEFEGSYERLSQLPRVPSPSICHKDAGIRRVRAEGFLDRVIVISKDMTFARLKTPDGEIQLFCHKTPDINQTLKDIPIGSAVRAIGVVHKKAAPRPKGKGEKGQSKPEPLERTADRSNEEYIRPEEMEIHLAGISCLNSFASSTSRNPTDSSIKHPPEKRHLQIRFDTGLAKRLRFRSDVMRVVRNQFRSFQEIETPVLFKSTPEGAREFLVPTRRKGYAYALPQSPQQYKQILMASGVSKYFQFARCFRDEDLRADRQPEFTQIDLEMAWATGSHVMKEIEDLIRALYEAFSSSELLQEKMVDKNHIGLAQIPIMSYSEAMSHHGSDKPDLRIDGKIANITEIVPSELRNMLTGLETPSFDAWRFRTGSSPKEVRAFVQKFLDSPDAVTFRENADGAPGICIFDERSPLEGLQTFGHEGSEQLKEQWLQHEGEFEDGDLLVFQARQSGSFYGGSTALGRLRLAIHKAAIAEGLIEQKSGHHYLWVTEFPMFTPDNETDPGQGGRAGFSATHHPFTAPNTLHDFNLLRTDPLAAKADHYDLVVNGVELGGGSRRIHNAEVQKYVMRDILQMSEERMDDFSHLFDALSSGCPPHAGFAIGFDRLIAVLTGRESVKDVIAFPKSSKGEDMMVRSPSRVTNKELETYHLQLSRGGKSVDEGQPVLTAVEDSKISDPPSRLKGVEADKSTESCADWRMGTK